VEELDTPAYVINERVLDTDMRLLRQIADQAGCQLLYSPKASSLAPVLSGVAKHADGFACSSLFELRLVNEICAGDGSLHLVSPLIESRTLEEFGDRLNYVTFNSLSQWRHLRAHVSASTSVGLRINPELSFIRDPRYDPCRSNSKLGVPVSRLAELMAEDRGFLRGVDGLHFHSNCESTDFASLLATARHIQDVVPLALEDVSWINLGGGYLFQSVEESAAFFETVALFRDGFGLQVFTEPGAAAVRRCGTIVSTVCDIFEGEDCQIAVLDTSVNHMPEVLEFQFEPDVLGHVDDGVHTYILAGCTCLAGDSFGQYAFDTPLTIGSQVTFMNMGAYSASKAHRFNGVALPTIYLRCETGRLEEIWSDDFNDFARNAGNVGSSIVAPA
jgi:carboxynorspermidine decarboxylase